jgi:GNAT superfamily N-acetyltransferase
MDMTNTPTRATLAARQATVADLGEALEVLDAAARRLEAQGIRQWPTAFAAEEVIPRIEAGQLWLFGDGAGTVTLDYEDPLWVGRPARAAYIHRLAVRESGGGLGRAILAWVGDRVASQGCELLRLDCVAHNARLRHYYERAGYEYVADVREVALFERRLTPDERPASLS